MNATAKLALICLLISPLVSAQRSEGQTTETAAKPINRAALEFSRPQLVDGVAVGSMLAGRFDCGEDNNIYTLIASDAPQGDPDSHLAVLGIHPDGTTTAFNWWSAPGINGVSGPNAIFAGNDRLYVLVRSESASDESQRPQRFPVVLVFNRDGSLQGTVKLDPERKPLAFGVFPSGNILLASEDRLNHRIDLSLVNSQGIAIREIPLGKNDFVSRAAQLPPLPHSSAKYSSMLLIAMSKFIPSDGKLLMVPLETGDLPILELDEHGVLAATMPNLPPDSVIEGFVSSSASTFTLHLAKVLTPQRESNDAQGKLLAVATEPSQKLTEISREDGQLLREIDLGSAGVKPACAANGVYSLLTSGNSQRLQVASAHVR